MMTMESGLTDQAGPRGRGHASRAFSPVERSSPRRSRLGVDGGEADQGRGERVRALYRSEGEVGHGLVPPAATSFVISGKCNFLYNPTEALLGAWPGRFFLSFSSISLPYNRAAPAQALASPPLRPSRLLKQCSWRRRRYGATSQRTPWRQVR